MKKIFGRNSKVKEQRPSTVEKQKINVQDLEISGLINDKRVITPQTYSQLVPFTVKDCKSSKIFIMCALNQCIIENTHNSFIFVGPTEGSVYIRNCSELTVAMACNQLRLVDCTNVYLNLHCTGQPTLESCKKIIISKFQYDYKELLDQYTMANVDPTRNDFENVHDYSAGKGVNYNFGLPPRLEIPEGVKVTTVLNLSSGNL